MRWILLSSALAAAPLAAQDAARADTQLAAFDTAWASVYRTHFDSTFNGVDWVALRDSLRPRAVGAPRDSVRRLIRRMLAELGQSHFALIDQEDADGPPGGSDAGDGTAGLEVRLIAGDLLVTTVDAGGAAEAAGIQRGWRLVSVDTSTVTGLLERLKESKARYPVSFLAAAAAGAWLSGAPGTTVRVKLEDGAGREQTFELVRRESGSLAVKFGNFPTFHARFDTRRVSGPAGVQAGLIWFNTWMAPLVRRVDSAVHAYRDLNGIVLDLRGNRGGLGAMVSGMAGHFTDRRDTLGTQRTRQATLYFIANPRRVAPDGSRVEPFSGPVAILTDVASASASEVFAGGLQSLGRVRVFGDTTLGAVLPAVADRLPNGDILYHAFAEFTTSTGVRLEGRGVIPDEVVPLSRAELLAGKDPVLEAALRWIATNRTTGGSP